jgi:hypothetical protein
LSNVDGAYPRVEHMKGATHDLMERLARGKHSSLFQTFVMDGRKRFYKIGALKYCALYDNS